ncbi:hypothetical protein ACJ41O_001394 [Fusarium nematophilum]
MDQNGHAADENTTLAGPPQRAVGPRGAPAAPFWNLASPTENGGYIWELFEVCRRSANRYLMQYFDCLDRIRASSAEVDAHGRLQEIVTCEGSGTDSDVWRLKISHDSAVRDLNTLDKILDKAREEGKPPGRAVFPGVAVWTLACSIFALTVPNRVPLAFFKVGALAGALLFTFRPLWKPPRVDRLGTVQSKVQGLIQSFGEGTMQQRDRGEVLISPMDSGTRR